MHMVVRSCLFALLVAATALCACVRDDWNYRPLPLADADGGADAAATPGTDSGVSQDADVATSPGNDTGTDTGTDTDPLNDP